MFNAITIALLIFAGWCFGSAYTIYQTSKEKQEWHDYVHSWYTNKAIQIEEELKHKHEAELADLESKHKEELSKLKRIARHYEVVGSDFSPFNDIVKEYFLRNHLNTDVPDPVYVKPMYQLDLDIGDMQASELWLKDPPYCPNMTEVMIRDIEDFIEKTGARPEDIVIAPTIIAPDGSIKSGIAVIPREVY